MLYFIVIKRIIMKCAYNSSLRAKRLRKYPSLLDVVRKAAETTEQRKTGIYRKCINCSTSLDMTIGEDAPRKTGLV